MGPIPGLVVSTLEYTLTNGCLLDSRGDLALCGCTPWPMMWPLHDATVTPRTTRTCAPNPGAVIDRAQLIRAVCGPAEPKNRPRETPISHTVPFSRSSLRARSARPERRRHTVAGRTPSPEKTPDAPRRRTPEERAATGETTGKSFRPNALP